jgi:hypothetical protein
MSDAFMSALFGGREVKARAKVKMADDQTLTIAFRDTVPAEASDRLHVYLEPPARRLARRPNRQALVLAGHQGVERLVAVKLRQQSGRGAGGRRWQLRLCADSPDGQNASPTSLLALCQN